MRRFRFCIQKKKWILIAVATFSVIIVLALIFPMKNVEGTDIPQYDFDQLGTSENPTTDWKTLREALEALGQRSLQNKGGWLHFRYCGYNPSDGLDHPFYSKDGYYSTEMWYYVNEARETERTLGIRMDMEGNELQVIACGDGICGNLSMLRLGDEYPGTAIGDFSPSVRPASTSGIIAEIDALENPSIIGWVEGAGDSQTLYITRTYSPGEAGEDIDPIVGSQIIIGFDISSGETAYYKDSILGEDGSYELILEDRLISFNIEKDVSAVENRYAQVIRELLEGK